MAYPVSAAGVKDFLEFLADKGELNQNTAGGLKTACEKIFSALDDGERANLKGLDVAQAVRRFVNKNPKALAPASIGVYQSRVARALQLLDKFNADPGAFKSAAVQGASSASTKSARPGITGRKSNGKTGPSKPAAPVSREHRADSTTSHGSAQVAHSAVNLSFPLRADFVAQFIVPRDLTVKEAKRLGAYFTTIAVDFEPS